MNRNFKNLVLTATVIMALGTASVSFAAAKPAAGANPGVAKANNTAAAATKKGPKISQDQATQIALKAHQGATVTSIELVGKVYVAKLTSKDESYSLKIGANTGRILKDKTIKSAAAKTATTDKAVASKKK